MELLLMRHGPAGDSRRWLARGRADAERPLTETGRRKTRRAAEGLARLLPRLDLIASSPLLRARQTADALARLHGEATRSQWAQLRALR
ncbi:MAG: histidine phosphatase family protein [Elusimicrobia bacterium]|nr:histidine phosphatase family protein [Elusimicrobiota bacterium]MDE2426522.1 histidine phosphatase family protein [Elusimicrobiota bacterium]